MKIGLINQINITKAPDYKYNQRNFVCKSYALSKDRVSFTSNQKPIEITHREYKSGISDVIFKNGLVLNNKNIVLGDNITSKGTIFTFSYGVKTGDNLSTSDIVADKDIELGNNIYSRDLIVSKSGSVIAGDNLDLEGIMAEENIILGDNVKTRNTPYHATKQVRKNGKWVKKEINSEIKGYLTSHKGVVKVGKNLDTYGILHLKSDLEIGSIKNLENIIFAKNTKEPNREFILRSEIIKQQEKPKIYLYDNTYLTIKTPSGNKAILDKFQIFKYKGNNVLKNAKEITKEEIQQFIKVQKIKKGSN